MAKLTQEIIPFKDAMENLARLAALNLSAPPRVGIVGKGRLVTDAVEFPEVDVLWLTEEGGEPLLEVLDLTFMSIHDHLKRLAKTMDWESGKSRQAVESMMALCGEAAIRFEKYLELQLGHKVPIMSRPSMMALQDDYVAFASRMKQDAPQEAADTLENLETVRQDRDYELFFIRKEDGSPYFSTDLVRHMRLIADFDTEGESFEEDPLLQVRSMMDRDLQASAKQILEHCYPLVTDFFKIYKRLANNDFASCLSQAIMALLLAGNPRNLVQNTTSKSCQQYFEDFLSFLRATFRTDEYQKFVAYPPEKSDKIAHLLLNLAHMLTNELYTRAGGVKQEAVGLIHRTTRKGTGLMQKGETLWSQLSIDDENYRSRLAKFPSGPLFKTLDVVRLEENEEVAFDPMMQGNVPMKLFGFRAGKKQIQVLRIPCPTKQAVINKAEILDEMRGLLRYYNSTGSKRKHLLINLQDRTSWKEFIRCKMVEEMQKNAEFNPALVVVTLAKNTDFYSQADVYANVGKADELIAGLIQQFEDPEGHGFYFPSSFRIELSKFVREAAGLIHRHFFDKRNSLTRREREDFLEIFDQLLALKLIDHYQPTTVSFTCKDAIDTGAAASALFFAFIHLLKGKFAEKQEVDYFRWLLYAPSLFVRERALDPERFNRVLTALERVDQAKASGLAFEKLFSSGFLDALEFVT